MSKGLFRMQKTSDIGDNIKTAQNIDIGQDSENFIPSIEPKIKDS